MFSTVIVPPGAYQKKKKKNLACLLSEPSHRKHFDEITQDSEELAQLETLSCKCSHSLSPIGCLPQGWTAALAAKAVSQKNIHPFLDWMHSYHSNHEITRKFFLLAFLQISLWRVALNRINTCDKVLLLSERTLRFCSRFSNQSTH